MALLREVLQEIRRQRVGGTGLDLTAATGATGVTIDFGAGTPEGVVAAPVGSIFLRTDGGALTTLYVKESGSGNTGWAAK